MPRLTIAAIVAGEPGPLELWTLRALAERGALSVVPRPAEPEPPPLGARARLLLLQRGPAGALARLAADALAEREAQIQYDLLEEYCDARELRAWRREARLERADEASMLARPPDVIVRVSGRADRALYGHARSAALEVRFAGGPWSVFWGIVEGKPELIAASVRRADTGRELRRTAPQLAPGDSAAGLMFRAHAQAVAALGEVLDALARGTPLAELGQPAAAEREEPGLAAWLRYIGYRAGRRAPVLLERGFAC